MGESKAEVLGRLEPLLFTRWDDFKRRERSEASRKGEELRCGTTP